MSSGGLGFLGTGKASGAGAILEYGGLWHRGRNGWRDSRLGGVVKSLKGYTEQSQLGMHWDAHYLSGYNDVYGSWSPAQQSPSSIKYRRVHKNKWCGHLPETFGTPAFTELGFATLDECAALCRKSQGNQVYLPHLPPTATWCIR
jgi:hypothetical protein